MWAVLKQSLGRISLRFVQLLFNALGLDQYTGFKVQSIHQFEKLGTEIDGWYIPLGFLNENSVCYCAGAGEDISFDIELVKKFNCDVFIFDPTPRAIEHFATLKKVILTGGKMPISNRIDIFYELSSKLIGKLHYFNYGIWSENKIMKFFEPRKKAYVSHSITNIQNTEEYFEAQCKTIESIMRELGHNKIDLLKLDIEGAECEVIDFILRKNISIKILCVEFDELSIRGWNSFKKIRRSINSLLKSGFILSKTDGQNYTFIKNM